MSLDIYEVCGDVIESFRDRQTKVADLIWVNQANISGVDLDKSSLSYFRACLILR